MNNNYLPPFLLTNVMLHLTETKFSFMGSYSSLFLYLFIHSDSVLSKYHRTFDYSSNIIDSNLLFKLSIHFIETRPLYFKNLSIQDDHCITVECKDTTIKIYNNSNIYNNHDYLSLLNDPLESYGFDNLVKINKVHYHGIDFKIMSVEDTISSLFFNYYNHKDNISLLDAVTLLCIYKDEVVFNKLIIRCLQIFNNTNPFLAALAASEYFEYTYLYSLNYTQEYILSVIHEVKKHL